MRLTWKDVVSTLFMAAIVAVYLAFGSGTSLWLISSARGAVTAVLVLGIVGGCALSAAGSLYQQTLTRSERVYRTVASVLGLVALIAAVAGLITGSTVMLAILFATTIALWLTATVRHAFGGPPATQVDHRDVDQLIGHNRMAVR
jgi:hypothetical protein